MDLKHALVSFAYNVGGLKLRLIDLKRELINSFKK